MSPLSAFERLTPVVSACSILAVALAAGTNLSTTIITLPALVHASPSVLATQWKTLYDGGLLPVVSLTMTSAVGFATLAYRSALNPGLAPTGLISHTKRNLYIAAAVAAFSLAPYTGLVMRDVILKLSKQAEAVKATDAKTKVAKSSFANVWDDIEELERSAKAAAELNEKGDTHELVRKWGTLNGYRGCMLLSSAVFGLWATAS
ncbi:hypothetical protein ACN47E_009528 [Coniothyrium glycines]